MAPNMKAALSASLKAEDAAVKNRFDQADKILGETTKSVEVADPRTLSEVCDHD
jgi:hypothetical protein